MQPETVTRHLDKTHPRVVVAIESSNDNLGRMIRQLERHLGSERVTFQRLPPMGWEARSWSGRVGRGDTLTDAVHDLLEQYGQLLAAA